jgi:glutathione synthase/RimK-type ligase-like ATP-grasp enzyme
MIAVLILTDHRTHSSIESIYPLARAIARDPRVSRVACLSRGNTPCWDALLGRTRFPACLVDGHFESPDQLSATQAHSFDLGGFDVIFMRMDRPFDSDVVRALSSVARDTLVLNSLQGMLELGKKSALPRITARHPPLQVCRNVTELRAVLAQGDECVIKHDETFGARGVHRRSGSSVEGSDGGSQSVESFLGRADFSSGGYVVVPFLPRVSKGDKRLLVAGGKLISATNRVPKPGGWLANLRCGATSSQSCPTDEELVLVEECDQVMSAKGIFLYSIDTLEDDQGRRIVSEVNVLNVGILPFGDQTNVEAECSAVALEFVTQVRSFLGAA